MGVLAQQGTDVDADSLARRLNVLEALQSTGGPINATAGTIAQAVKLFGRVTSATAAPYNATGDGVTDDSAAIQSAINDIATRGGGVLFFPPGTYRCNVILKAGVVLSSEMGGQFGYLAGGSPVSAVTFLQASAGYVVDTPVTPILGCGVQGINFKGLGAATAGGGIRYQWAGWSSIRGCNFYNFADEAITLLSNCGACTIEDVLDTDCVLNRARAAVIGAVDISGNDHFLSRVEAGISGNREGTVQSLNLYCVAVALRGANCMLSAVLGEFSDVGIYITGSQNRLSDCRADLNYGHGWFITGGGNLFSACLGLNNSQDTTNTYDNWQLTSTSNQNQLSACRANVSVGKAARYGFNDLVSSDSTKNFHTNCNSSGAGTQDYINVGFAGSSMQMARGPARSLTANSTTPSVSGYENWKTANSGATTITNFTAGVSGQQLQIFCTDANTTIQHNGSTITTTTGANVVLVNGTIYKFYKDNGNWRQVP